MQLNSNQIDMLARYFSEMNPLVLAYLAISAIATLIFVWAINHKA